MPFGPRNERHAIAEVVFGIWLARPFRPDELDALAREHGRWKEFLPKLSRGSIVNFVFGDVQPPVTMPPPIAASVAFDRMHPDGTLAWRFRAEEHWLYVNCLDYVSWQDVYVRARRYLAEACSIGMSADNSIKGVLLQYIDEFRWEGEPPWDLKQLFQEDSEYVPSSIYGRIANWHLHQGWFRSSDLPMEGRILERMHVDGLQQSKPPAVRMDNFLRLELQERYSPAAFFEGGADAPCEKAFSYLHDLNKTMLRAYLTEEMAQRIALEAVE